MQITATLVKELRERTGAGMMDCKKALLESNGDIEVAIEEMRKSGVAKAAKKAGRIAAEGNIVIKHDNETGESVILEINSETDFVAKDENFRNFGEIVAGCVLANHPADVDALSSRDSGEKGAGTIEELRQQLVSKIGENINIRRFTIMKSEKGMLGEYLHGHRIGVLVDIQNADENLARDIAMHIAGSNPPPICVSEEQVPVELLEKEKEIFTAQAAESGKPADIVEKMVEGKINKFIREISLLSQAFVKDTEKSVGQLLESASASVIQFARFEVGEGLEKKDDNFAEEVMAQARGE